MCVCAFCYIENTYLLLKLSQEGDRDKENWSLGMQLANHYISGDY